MHVVARQPCTRCAQASMSHTRIGTNLMPYTLIAHRHECCAVLNSATVLSAEGLCQPQRLLLPGW